MKGVHLWVQLLPPGLPGEGGPADLGPQIVYLSGGPSRWRKHFPKDETFLVHCQVSTETTGPTTLEVQVTVQGRGMREGLR